MRLLYELPSGNYHSTEYQVILDTAVQQFYGLKNSLDYKLSGCGNSKLEITSKDWKKIRAALAFLELTVNNKHIKFTLVASYIASTNFNMI
ncbi:hypothetical protein SS50377_26963 [Spironucleus salmonicida]|uniref:Uncharacterized protein n=1 Tax=Spironucleus salmonicida TaxID=348837 RepID=V6LT87_9EUKA|nr:hypothetical protein SS50377_26963 [Spironucleus salmonicida]|eukprot:EST47473.1 Hypothetical protein SS50377_12459 [Spironucleus salmonicida]